MRIFHTLYNIPASARAVYAPRENPGQRGASEPLSMRATMWTRRTEQANFVANIVILHKEIVSIYHMLIEIPSNSLIQELGSPLKDW